VKFAHPWWLLAALGALVVAALLVAGGISLVRAVRRFGDEERVRALTTAQSGKRRAAKGVLLVLATALVFVAMARPQYGRGTRLIPATNLDVVVVLDYSKSMYARDVVPSRIARAKAEVARLIRDLPGARFAAVAFAGEPIGFPLTSDGMAVAQFFRQLEPNDMPVGGTAIGRALERARELLQSDPKSKDHRRVIVLVTDGEDLEGDPVAVARSIGESGTTLHVVQIGGRTPERVPEVDPTGKVAGYRTDDDGKPLMTSLSAEGEAQLLGVAQAAGGHVVRSDKGSTGIEVIAAELRQLMHSELAEKVETIFADVYAYPLGAALALLVAEAFVGEARRRRERVAGRGNR
jgi:Ca-activated chloride channel family protein